VGASFPGLSFSCEGIPLLKYNAVRHTKNPAVNRHTTIFARIEHVPVSSEIDFKGIVTRIAGSFQKIEFIEQFVLCKVTD
jgi:hypothetical protein